MLATLAGGEGRERRDSTYRRGALAWSKRLKTHVRVWKESMAYRVYSPIVTSYQKERERKERRRRVVTRVVGVVIAAAMLISLVVPAIYAGL